MSRTYEIACTKCKKKLWIGQGTTSGRKYLYQTEEHWKELGKFMFDHLGHELVFQDSEFMDDDYESVDGD